MADPDPEISGGWGGGGGGLEWASVWSKNKGEGQGPQAHPLDLPLKGVAQGGGRAVAGERFILKESLDIYTFPVNRTITHVFEPCLKQRTKCSVVSSPKIMALFRAGSRN